MNPEIWNNFIQKNNDFKNDLIKQPTFQYFKYLYPKENYSYHGK